MKRFLLSWLLLTTCSILAVAQRWQGQIGTNLAALPGRSIELATAWSPNLNQWALTLNTGYTYRNPTSAVPVGYVCDCGISTLTTSGAFVKAGARIDAIRAVKSRAKIGLPIGLILIGSQYQQDATIRSFPSGKDIYTTLSAQGVVFGAGVTAAMNIRLSSRWNVDLGVQKFIGLQKRTDYLLFPSYITYQPGIGLTNWDRFWPGLQGIATVNYRLRGL